MKSSVKAVSAALVLCAMTAMSGCSGLTGSQRRSFAGHVMEGSGPIVNGYRECVGRDAALSPDERRMRLRLADEFEEYVKEGSR